MRAVKKTSRLLLKVNKLKRNLSPKKLPSRKLLPQMMTQKVILMIQISQLPKRHQLKLYLLRKVNKLQALMTMRMKKRTLMMYLLQENNQTFQTRERRLLKILMTKIWKMLKKKMITKAEIRKFLLATSHSIQLKTDLEEDSKSTEILLTSKCPKRWENHLVLLSLNTQNPLKQKKLSKKKIKQILMVETSKLT